MDVRSIPRAAIVACALAVVTCELALVAGPAAAAPAAARPAAVAGPAAHAVATAVRPAQAGPWRASPPDKLPEADYVASQVDLTRELLERGRNRLAACGAPRTQRLLDTADDFQRRAEQASADGQHLAALQLTMGARLRVQRAMRECHFNEDARDGAGRALRRTDQVVDRAVGAWGGAPQGEAASLLQSAAGAQDQARRAFQDGRIDASMRLTLAARARAFRAGRLAHAVH